MELRRSRGIIRVAMPPTRRTTAAFMLFLLLQVLGLGSGALRVAEASADCETAMAQMGGDMANMPGMSMPDAPPPSPEHGSKAPCGLPWALGCSSAAACLPLLVTSGALRPTTHAVLQARIAAIDAAMPESPARAPELPPPRG